MTTKKKEQAADMSEEFVTQVKTGVSDAIAYIEDELGPERALAARYYDGEGFIEDEEGRSKAVLTEMRDAIKGVIPAVLRILHGPEGTVEYVPTNAANVPGAKQATAYARYVFEDLCGGFLIDHAVLKDGLIKKLGVVKWGETEVAETKTTPYVGITQEELMHTLSSMPDAQLKISAKYEDGTFDAEITEVSKAGQAWVRGIATDDFFWNREATSMADATLVGNRDRLTKNELLALGISEDDIDEHGGSGSGPKDTEEELERRASRSADKDPDVAEGNKKYLYCDVYMLADNGELRRICTLGEQYHPVRNKPAPEKPFALFTPDPEPHAMLGLSFYDLLKGPQKINTQLLRGMLDSLSASLFPRPAYVEGQVSVADILNNEIGAPIRQRQPGMVEFKDMPFTGEKVMPIMGFMQDVVERRTGSKGAQGLDMDALQSTEANAAAAALQANTAHAELLTYIYAEQLLKPLMRGLLRIISKPGNAGRIARINGQYVPVDPSQWSHQMGVRVKVALGSMNTEKKIQVLMAVVADQSAILSQFGPTNPVVTLPMLRNAKAEILRLQGIENVDDYYMPLAPDYQPPPPPPPEPTVDEKWMETEKKMSFEKNMKDLAVKQDELALKREELVVMRELKVRELAQQLALEKYKIDSAAEQADLDRNDAALDREIDKEVAETEMAIDTAMAVHERKMEHESHQHEMELAEREHEHTIEESDRAFALAARKQESDEKVAAAKPKAGA